MTGRSFCYKGVYYDIGTKLKIKTRYNGIVLTTYLGPGNFEGLSKYSYDASMPPEHYIVEIVEPVYWQTPEPDKSKAVSPFLQTGSGSWQSSDDVVLGFVWYIVIMAIGLIFKDRWLIWIVATLVFFGWKSNK